VKEMTATESALANRRRATEEQVAGLQRGIENGQKELAALRYAVLEGCRLGAQVGRGQRQTIQHGTTGLIHLVSALLSSPLSPSQRRLATSLHEALEDWRKDQTSELASTRLPVCAPAFQPSEFNLKELALDSYGAIQRIAAAQGVGVQIAYSGPVPEKVLADPGHLSQLLTLLAESCLRLPKARRLALKLSAEPTLPGPARLQMEVLITTEAQASVMCERIRAITTAAHTLQTAQLDEAELGLAVCWELAHALGGTLQFEVATGQDVRLDLRLPVEITSPPCLTTGEAVDLPKNASEASENG
jgi:hypothetical protein